MTQLFARITQPILLVVLMVFGAAPTGLLAAPEPEPVPRRWQLDVEPGELHVTVVNLPSGPQAYFYLPYMVTNNSGEDVYFAPTFNLYTPDDGSLVRSGRGIPREVTEHVLAELRNELVQDDIRVQGLLLQGREYAREGVAIWPANNLKVDDILIFATGFSGETRRIVRPDNGETQILRKTLMLQHYVPGDIDPTRREPIARMGDGRWILR
ncbi:MAG: hypothetical protein KDA21_13830 [Phycisphaerales bacterium]|nr:hypothetical protein [Phycisphaerales bacterium]